MTIKDKLDLIHQRIQNALIRAGRQSENITLIGVTKQVDTTVIQEAVSNGLVELGENRVQELLSKYDQVIGANWHMIGRLQRNKVKYIVDKAAMKMCIRDSCKFCTRCTLVCKEFKKEICDKLQKPPYVCNGCNNLRRCTLEKVIYSASAAEKEYKTVRSESRSGIMIDEAEAQRLDSIISPLIHKGQSIHHICSNNTDTIMCSEKTIYNYVNLNLSLIHI